MHRTQSCVDERYGSESPLGSQTPARHDEMQISALDMQDIAALRAIDRPPVRPVNNRALGSGRTDQRTRSCRLVRLAVDLGGRCRSR